MVAGERLCLGTVQWGLPYGIANHRGQPSREDVRRIIERAREAGIRTLDTARVYGDAERVVGEVVGDDDTFQIVTKLTPDLGEGSREDLVKRALASVETSRRLLRRDTLDTLLLHRAAHRSLADGAVWDALLELRAQGIVGRLGISVAEVDEAFPLLADESVEALQVPASLLDQRLARQGFFEAAKQTGKPIYIRSIFLQGIAFMKVNEVHPFLAPLAIALQQIDQWCRQEGVSRPEAFVAHAASLQGRLVVGFEHPTQLDDFLTLSATSETSKLAASIAPLAPEQLSPAEWLVAGVGVR